MALTCYSHNLCPLCITRTCWMTHRHDTLFHYAVGFRNHSQRGFSRLPYSLLCTLKKYFTISFNRKQTYWVISLHSKNSSNAPIQYSVFFSLAASNHTSVLSTFDSGGIGLKPSPGLAPINPLSSCHFGLFSSKV